MEHVLRIEALNHFTLARLTTVCERERDLFLILQIPLYNDNFDASFSKALLISIDAFVLWTVTERMKRCRLLKHKTLAPLHVVYAKSVSFVQTSFSDNASTKHSPLPTVPTVYATFTMLFELYCPDSDRWARPYIALLHGQ